MLFVALEERRRDQLVSLVKLYPCAEGETPRPFPVSRPPDALWPKTVDEAAGLLVTGLDEQSKAGVRDTPKEQLFKFHLGWAWAFATALGLWRGNTALLASCKVSHPDSCSGVIIERVWELLQPKDGG
ncbi:MAG: hypothetical protein JNK82_45165 [Myxococcaceae bacterium]|nr:hypothetical protein [Myxococcaceae bacterium]